MASLALAFLVSNYLSFQAGQTIRYYAPRTSKAEVQTAKKSRIYGVNQVLKYSPTRVDFGTLTGLEPRYEKVSFRNDSPEAVTIKRIKAGCGCTSAKLIGDKKIPAGGEGTLEIEVLPALASPELAASVSIEYEEKPHVDRILVSGQVVK